MTEAQIDDTHPYDDDDVSAPSARYGNEPYSASSSLQIEFDGILLDYSRQQATLETKKKLFKLAEVASLKQKINQMYNGEHINNIDNRSVLHVALRAPRDVVTLFVHTALQTDPEAIESTRGRQLRLQ